jgi:hypothetical protein
VTCSRRAALGGIHRPAVAVGLPVVVDSFRWSLGHRCYRRDGIACRRTTGGSSRLLASWPATCFCRGEGSGVTGQRGHEGRKFFNQRECCCTGPVGVRSSIGGENGSVAEDITIVKFELDERPAPRLSLGEWPIASMCR